VKAVEWLMERGERGAQENYRQLWGTIAEADAIAHDENAHEDALIELLDEERLRYTGSIVLGLNDALVELTGALAGFTLVPASGPWLGVNVRGPEEPLKPGDPLPKGVAVSGVLINSPAASAGLARGDVITRVDNEPVHLPADLRRALLAHAPGDSVTLRIDRNGTRKRVQVEIGSAPGVRLAAAGHAVGGRPQYGLLLGPAHDHQGEHGVADVGPERRRDRHRGKRPGPHRRAAWALLSRGSPPARNFPAPIGTVPRELLQNGLFARKQIQVYPLIVVLVEPPSAPLADPYVLSPTVFDNALLRQLVAYVRRILRFVFVVVVVAVTQQPPRQAAQTRVHHQPAHRCAGQQAQTWPRGHRLLSRPAKNATAAMPAITAHAPTPSLLSGGRI